MSNALRRGRASARVVSRHRCRHHLRRCRNPQSLLWPRPPFSSPLLHSSSSSALEARPPPLLLLRLRRSMPHNSRNRQCSSPRFSLLCRRSRHLHRRSSSSSGRIWASAQEPHGRFRSSSSPHRRAQRPHRSYRLHRLYRLYSLALGLQQLLRRLTTCTASCARYSATAYRSGQSTP